MTINSYCQLGIINFKLGKGQTKLLIVNNLKRGNLRYLPRQLYYTF